MNEQLSIALFKASPLPSLLLRPDSPHFTIVAVNDAYLSVTNTTEKDLLGQHLFQAFPDNPNDKRATGVRNLSQSLETVIRTKKTHKMALQKYDIPIRNTMGFEERYWNPENVPILNEKREVELIIHTVNDATHEVLREVENNLMFNNTQESFVLVDTNLIVVNFNDQFFKNYKTIFGREVKKGVSILEYAQPERRNTLMQLYQGVLKGETHTFELNISEADQQRCFKLTYKPARNADDSIFGAFVSILEITAEREAQQELAKAKNKYQGLVQAINGIVWEANYETFIFTYISPQAERILGFPLHEWYKNANFWVNQIHPDDREKAVSYCVEQARINDNYNFEYRMIAKNGQVVWIRDVVSVIRENNKPSMLRGIMVDITEQKNIDTKLRESNERFELATLATRDAIYDWNIEEDNIYWGKGYNTLFGYNIDEKEYPLNKWMKNVHPDDAFDTNEDLFRTLDDSSKSYWSCEYRLRKKSGAYAEILESGYIIRDKEGKAIRMIGAIRDISEKKRLENLLKAAQKLARVGGWEVDVNANKVNWTSITRAILEVGEDFEPTLRSGINFYLEGEHRERIARAVKDAIQAGKPYDLELKIVTAKGNERWVRTIGEAEMIKGKCVRLFGSFQDIHLQKMAETKLRELSLVAAKTTDIVVITDADRKITWVNQAYEKLTGYSLEESLGKNPGQLLQGPDTDPDTVKRMRAAIKNFESVNEVILNYTKGGEKYWLDLTIDPVFDDSGKCTHFIGIERDVSRAKYSGDLEMLEKEVLKLSNRKESSLEDIFGHYILGIESLHPDMICSIVRMGEDGRMYNWYADRLPQSFIASIDGQAAGPNAGSCGTAAYLKERVMVSDIEHDNRWKNYREPALRAGLRACWSHPIIDASGRVMATFAIYYKEVKKPSFREENIIERATNLLQIILEKYYAERAIEEAFEERETILQSISDAFYSVNSEWNFTYFNREAERLLHKSAAEVIGKNIWEAFPQAKDTELYNKYYNALAKNQPDAFEYFYPALNTWFDISVYPSPKGISVYFKDITVRKEADRQIKIMNEELKKRAEELTISNRELEQFAYVASHDLQEPLRMINGFMLRLQKKYEDKLDERAHLYIRFAVDGAVRMRKIILDLLEYSRAGRNEYEKEEVNMEELMEELVKFSALNIRRKEATIKWKKLPTVLAARIPIQQLMQNLLSNALKYRHPQRKPIIKIEAKELSGYWKFIVSDNGIGIEKQFFEKIFVIFQRLHSKEEYSGTGIGLAICKKIIENHDGEIWVESEPGIGSRFIFTLPK